MNDLPCSGSEQTVDIIVVDVIGLLRGLYALADIAFVGGSLVNAGGHNPLEPAAFRKPVLFGPDMSDFRQISEMLIKSGGGICIHDADGFYRAVIAFLKDEGKALKTGTKAHALLTANRGAVNKTFEGIDTVLNQKGS
jgi:3-deoxy-D-manno-octulosonic-acid transferase